MTVWMTKGVRWAALMAVSLAASIGATSCGFHHLKYENPIAKDTQQPDKILYDKAVKDLEHGRYELARLTLNTLINTYDTSEYLAKAKLAIADSWFREGGASGLAQAEAEYKDFELFYPNMPEAAESQYKICNLHFEQMSKPDRDSQQTLRAEQECKQVVLQFPNSKFIPQTEQLLRNIDEVLAAAEMASASFYYGKGSKRGGGQPLHRLGGSISSLQQGGRGAVERRRCVPGHGRAALAPQGRAGFAKTRPRLSPEPLRGPGQEEIARNGDGNSPAGSGGRRPHEI